MEPAYGSSLPGVTRAFPGTVGEIAVSAMWRTSYGNLAPKEAKITPVLLKTKDLGAVRRAFSARF